MSDRLLSLDVSSTATGFAWFDGETLGVFGVWRPGARTPSLGRIDEIVGVLRDTCEVTKPDQVVMEWSEGKVHGRIVKAAGLQILGQAQGSVRQALMDLNLPIEAVGESLWTYRTPKQKRADRVWTEYPAYRAFVESGQDRGLDAADAIGLGHWYLARQRLARMAVDSVASSRARR